MSAKHALEKFPGSQPTKRLRIDSFLNNTARIQHTPRIPISARIHPRTPAAPRQSPGRDKRRQICTCGTTARLSAINAALTSSIPGWNPRLGVLNSQQPALKRLERTRGCELLWECALGAQCEGRRFYHWSCHAVELSLRTEGRVCGEECWEKLYGLERNGYESGDETCCGSDADQDSDQDSDVHDDAGGVMAKEDNTEQQRVQDPGSIRTISLMSRRKRSSRGCN